jgi:hypothetical protein
MPSVCDNWRDEIGVDELETVVASYSSRKTAAAASVSGALPSPTRSTSRLFGEAKAFGSGEWLGEGEAEAGPGVALAEGTTEALGTEVGAAGAMKRPRSCVLASAV